MANIIIRNSRKRLVKMQRDLINQTNKHYLSGNEHLTGQRLSDFHELNNGSGLYKDESGRKLVCSYDPKGGEKKDGKKGS